MGTQNRRLAWILMTFLAGSGAAQSTVPSPAVPSPNSPPPGWSPAGPVAAETACLNWRWIGLKPRSAGSCPEPAGWIASSLFEVFPTNSPLGDFCLYEPRLGYGNETDIPGLVLQGQLLRADKDCMAVSTAADELTDLAWQDLRQQFLREAGGFSAADASVPTALDVDAGSTATRGDARLIFLDTEATYDDWMTSGPEKRTSMHGYTLAHLARELLCDGPRCSARIATRLALPIVDRKERTNPSTQQENLNIDHAKGGTIGTIGQLAQAILAAGSARNSPLERGVINLSLGWDGRRFGGLEPSVGCMPVPVQAVYRALEAASCRGHLVVAAAGNHAGGSEPGFGPLLPAAWEPRQAPDNAACQYLLPPEDDSGAPAKTTEGGAEPLLHAVAGVDSFGKPLANARPAALPRLAAYGDHAVAGIFEPSTSGSRPTAVLTGSSVATAVVSATAAALWHHFPELERADLMETLYQSGENLVRPAEFAGATVGATVSGSIWPTHPPNVHRVSACSALKAACGSECHFSLNCPSRLPGPPRLASLGDFGKFFIEESEPEEPSSPSADGAAIAGTTIPGTTIPGTTIPGTTTAGTATTGALLDELPGSTMGVDTVAVDLGVESQPAVETVLLPGLFARPIVIDGSQLKESAPGSNQPRYGRDHHAWVGPQPQNIPCPTCSMGFSSQPDTFLVSADSGTTTAQGCSGATLYIQISNDSWGLLNQATLEIGKKRFALDKLGTLHGGRRAIVNCIDEELLRSYPPVNLTFVSSTLGLLSSPILLVDK